MQPGGNTELALQEITARIHGWFANVRENVARIGLELAAAKEILPKGQYLKWVKQEFGLSSWMASRYVRIGVWSQTNPDLAQHLAPSSILVLTEIATSDATLAEVARRIREKGGAKYEEVRAIAKRTRSPPPPPKPLTKTQKVQKVKHARRAKHVRERWEKQRDELARQKEAWRQAATDIVQMICDRLDAEATRAIYALTPATEPIAFFEVFRAAIQSLVLEYRHDGQEQGAVQNPKDEAERHREAPAPSAQGDAADQATGPEEG